MLFCVFLCIPTRSRAAGARCHLALAHRLRLLARRGGSLFALTRRCGSVLQVLSMQEHAHGEELRARRQHRVVPHPRAQGRAYPGYTMNANALGVVPHPLLPPLAVADSVVSRHASAAQVVAAEAMPFSFFFLLTTMSRKSATSPPRSTTRRAPASSAVAATTRPPRRVRPSAFCCFFVGAHLCLQRKVAAAAATRSSPRRSSPRRRTIELTR